MCRQITKEECDLILQGAVVLAGGGGGPLHFARYILEEISEDDKAVIARPSDLKEKDWMAMIALVGTPSKVHVLPVSPGHAFEPTSSPQAHRKGRSSPGATVMDRVRSALYERFRRKPVVSFLCYGMKRRISRSQPTSMNSPNNAARNTFLYLEKQCKQRVNDYDRFKNFTRFSYLLTGELGAVNMATALYLSAIFGVAVVDCEGAGRSVPQVNQITFAGEFNVAPTAIVSSEPGPDLENIASTLLDFPCGSEKMVEDVATALIADQRSPFNPYIGYGTYVIKAEQMKDVPVFGSYSLALDVGKALRSFYGRERANAVSQALTVHGRPNRIVCHGNVKRKVLLHNMVKDTGYIDVKDRENFSTMRLWYRNEIILAGDPDGIPSYMAPDSICILPADDPPMDISSIQDPPACDDGTEVFVLVIEAVEKIKTPKVIKSFEDIYPAFTGNRNQIYYEGKYIPWSAADSKIEDE